MSSDKNLHKEVSAALAHAPRRVIALTLADGRRVWLKRVERPSLRLRIQKGDPARAFAAERAGLRLLASRGLPVPPIVLEGKDHFVLADAGPTLAVIAADGTIPVPARLAAFAGGGRALAGLHRAGLAHGRPAVRDICWDGLQARFIDLERFSPRRQGVFWQAVDLVLLVQSIMTKWADDPRWCTVALDAYVAAAPPEVPVAAARLARMLAPLGWIARGLRSLRLNSRELRAVPLTLDRLATLTRAP